MRDFLSVHVSEKREKIKPWRIEGEDDNRLSHTIFNPFGILSEKQYYYSSYPYIFFITPSINLQILSYVPST